MFILAISTAVLAAQGFVLAQAEPKRTPIQQGDLSAPGYEVLTQVVEVYPGNNIDWHTHPGEEVTYVMAGELTLEQAGKPVRVVKTGEGFIIPGGTAHAAANKSNAPVRIVVNYVVQKGKPLRTAVPKP
jgi:quercetin dioxygenase-like cupin family protein